MTHPAEQDEYAEPAAPVQVAGVVTVESGHLRVGEEAADFGAYTTISVPVTAGWNQQVLPFDKHRARAYLVCSGNGPVWVGTAAQCQANPPLGFSLASGVALPVMHQQALWIASSGQTATVSIAIERWDA